MIEVHERFLAVDLADGMKAYGIFREVPGALVVIMAHGLGQSADQHPLPAAALALSEAGFSSFRFNFYGFALDARRLADSTIDSLVNDFDAVVSYFRKTHAHVSVIGHSVGALVVLCSKRREFDSAVLWDCSPPGAGDWKAHPQYWIWHDDWKRWTPASGIQYVVEDSFPSSQTAVDSDAVIRSFDRPLKFINAAQYPELTTFASNSYGLASHPKALATIDGADHGFTLETHATQLFRDTIEWLNKHGCPKAAEVQ
jgi:pimeloyl-ACP methyl ester carboxylesterase